MLNIPLLPPLISTILITDKNFELGNSKIRKKISQCDFCGLHGIELGKVLVQPVVAFAKTEGMDGKERVIACLSEGQRSLISFFVWFGRIEKGWFDYCLKNFNSGDTFHLLTDIKESLKNTRDLNLLRNIEEAERLFISNLPVFEDSLGKSYESRRKFQADLKVKFKQLDREMFKLLENSIDLMESFIRSTPSEFVDFRD